MRLLALDTSTESCSVALLQGRKMSLRAEITDRSHAELVLPMVDQLLTEAELSLVDLDGIAFGRGPGAFTGLRIAAGVVQGLAFGANLKVAPVSSLAAVAAQIPGVPGESVLVCNDARMGEVYWGVFRLEADGLVTALSHESVSPPHRVGEGAARVNHAAGNALARHPILAERLGSLGLSLHEGLLPRADAVARLGARLIASGEGLPPDQALPVYVRDDVARAPGTSVT